MSEPLRIHWETRLEDILESFEVIDFKNGANRRRNVPLLGILFILLLFTPDLLKDPKNLVYWGMIVLALLLMAMIFLYPQHVNRSFARRKVQNSPEYLLELTADGMHLEEGGGAYEIPFDGAVCVFDYKGTFAVSFDRNRSFAIPKDQLDEQTVAAVRSALKNGLGERFERVINDYAPRSPLTGKRKSIR